jgi:hypothetical protein
MILAIRYLLHRTDRCAAGKVKLSWFLVQSAVGYRLYASWYYDYVNLEAVDNARHALSQDTTVPPVWIQTS